MTVKELKQIIYDSLNDLPDDTEVRLFNNGGWYPCRYICTYKDSQEFLGISWELPEEELEEE